MARGDSTAFAELLRELRLAAGLSQEALAETSGLSARGIYELEHGRHQPYRDTVERLGRGLELQGEHLERFQLAARPKPRHPANRRPVPHTDAGDAAVTIHPQGLASDAMPLPLHNLPIELTSFIGRASEVSRAQDLLRTTRLLTLVGSGGCGKTRLALRVTAEVVGEYPDGAWLVELAPLSDPRLVIHAIAWTLGIRERPGQPLLETLQAELKGRHLLILLDNCEHLVEECAKVAESILKVCPTVRVLATSREALRAAGELVFWVPSLAVPDVHQDLTPDRLSEYEGVKLLVERAREVRPTFQVTESNAKAVAEVCTRLDGIPLALELAAARLDVLSVEQVASRLDQVLKLLTQGRRTALRRHQTLRAAVDWSYDLLTEPEKALFRRIAVFAGGWTLEAAEAVCSGDGVEPGDVLDLLQRLVEKSLVVTEHDADHWEVRYRLLETLREYGQARLGADARADAVQRRHITYYLTLAEQAEPGRSTLRGVGEEWVARLEPDIDNLRAALNWCAGSVDGADRELGLRLGGALWPFWSLGLRWREGLDRLEALLAQPGPPTPGRAAALYAAGYLSWHLGDPQTTGAFWKEGLALARRLGDSSSLARLLAGVGSLVYLQGEVLGGVALLEEALDLARARNDRWLELGALFWLGNVALSRGDLEQAESRYEQCYVGARELGIRRDLARGSVCLGYLSLLSGDYTHASALMCESLSMRRDIADTWGIAQSLDGLALLFTAKGLTRRAVQLLGAAEAVRERLGGAVTLPQEWWQTHSRSVEVARASLGEDEFAAAWSEGQVMALDQAVEYALQDWAEP